MRFFWTNTIAVPRLGKIWTGNCLYFPANFKPNLWLLTGWIKCLWPLYTKWCQEKDITVQPFAVTFLPLLVCEHSSTSSTPEMENGWDKAGDIFLWRVLPVLSILLTVWKGKECLFSPSDNDMNTGRSKNHGEETALCHLISVYKVNSSLWSFWILYWHVVSQCKLRQVKFPCLTSWFVYPAIIRVGKSGYSIQIDNTNFIKCGAWVRQRTVTNTRKSSLHI